jgi:TPR repeat protein
MPVFCGAVKVFPIALLFLSMMVVSSAQSIAELKKQAAAGDASAQFKLGFAYDSGNGVPKDQAEAVLWYRKAADQGYSRAQYDLDCSGSGIRVSAPERWAVVHAVYWALL